MPNLAQTLKLRALLLKLKSEDFTRAVQAAEALGELKDTRAVNDLAQVLEFAERYLARQAAARALGQIGDRAAVPALITALDDAEDHVRVEVVRALATLHDSAAVPRIAAMLRNDSAAVREAAVQALAGFGPEPVAWLVVMLRREAFFTRQSAARALGLIGGEKAAAALLEALHDEDYIVRCEVIEALARLGSMAEGPLRELALDPRVKVRLAAIKTLTRIREPRACRVLEDATRDDEPEVREAAWHALAILDWPPAHEREGIQRAIQFGDFARAAAAGAAAVEPLLEVFRVGNLEARDKVRAAINQIGLPARVGLLRALKDLDLDVRQFAAGVLDSLGWKPATAEERILAGIATGRYAGAVAEGAAAFEPLCAALRSHSEWDRVLAARALGELGDARAVAPLAQALGDEAFKVREAAVNALGRLGGEAVVPGLREAARDKHYNVASAARMALKQLGHGGED